MKPRERFGRQLCRALVIAEVLQPGWLSMNELTAAVNDRLPVGHEACERTIRRDVETMFELGYVEKRKMKGRPVRYRRV